jgi:NIPSNAP protein
VMNKTMLSVVGLVAAFAAGFVARGSVPGEAVVQAQAKPRVYELRTYTAVEGRLDALHARFKDHLLGFFQKHGITNVVYFKPMDAPLSETTLIYLVSHESREAAVRNWSAFQNDPEWKKVSAAGGGPMSSKVESVFLEPTDYSPMK